MLDDVRGRGGDGDMIYAPLSYHAMNTLAELVPNPPVERVIWPMPPQKYIEIWKKWFEKHKELLE